MTLATPDLLAARQQLAKLTADLGRPDRDLVILGEGNTSCRVDDESFLVKASGYSFVDATPESFVQVRFAPVMALVNRQEPVSEEELVATYQSAKVDPNDQRRPSVETVFHAALLQQPGVHAVAHTHPITVNTLTCSTTWPQCVAGRLFPDEAVVCGPAAALVDYVDPGVALSRRIQQAAHAYQQEYGQIAKQIILRNHGMIAVGSSLSECDRITAMAVKAAAIRLGALSTGGITTLGDAVTEALLDRPDEVYRQQQLAGR
jgi:rhamnose utilization protein RhaD (predicted bifunctional aldolase and dehydrogenase)